MTIQTPPPTPAIIPESAPFNADQRAWLNGFFAGLLALDAGARAASPGEAAAALGAAGKSDGDDGAAPWHDPSIEIADRMTMAEGRPLRRRMMAAMAQQDCGQCGYSCEDYADAITEQAEARLNLCVPGGKATARMLKSLVEDMGGGVVDPDKQAAKDARKIEAAGIASLAPGRSRDAPLHATFLSRRRLNGAASEKITNHIEFDLAGCGLDYEVGDSLGVFPENDPALVDSILAAISVPPDFPIAGKTIRAALIEDTSLSPAPDALFQLISYLVGGNRRKTALALGNGQDPDGDALTLDVLATLEKFPGLHPDPEAFFEVLEPMQPRLYSISSSIRANPGRVSLTVDAVRYTVGERERLGVASTYLDDRIVPGTTLRIYVQKAHGFALPDDGSVPIIMVGPGTGIAPFRAFLEDRRASAATGGAWLFYGHQHEASDFFYADELRALQENGVLDKLSLAWSRDGDRKVYVQDRMREAGGELADWIERGAHFYVCGDAKRMARDVEQALCDVLAERHSLEPSAARAKIAEMKAAGRYQADVY